MLDGRYGPLLRVAGEDRNVHQATMEIPTLTLEQVVEAMAVLPNDLWNLVC